MFNYRQHKPADQLIGWLNNIINFRLREIKRLIAEWIAPLCDAIIVEETKTTLQRENYKVVLKGDGIYIMYTGTNRNNSNVISINGDKISLKIGIAGSTTGVDMQIDANGIHLTAQGTTLSLNKTDLTTLRTLIDQATTT